MADDTRTEFLLACAKGDLAQIEQLHAQAMVPTTEEGVDVPFLQEAFTNAIDHQHAPVVDVLLQRSPPSFTSHLPDQVLLRALDAGADMYRRFVLFDRSVATRNFGHAGDALALAVLKNDLALLRLLLGHGASAADCRLFHRPIAVAARGLKDLDGGILEALEDAA
ncbi:hypothetical protein PG985_008232 [Apiospora marii]|uniref:Ankyrin repeat domain-containing protein n=1 Tax=Apiospora marii TaxID=335849 RepID=A0ABR1RAQ9_9PEZI